MHRPLLAALALPLLLAGCGNDEEAAQAPAATPVTRTEGADSMASDDPLPGEAVADFVPAGEEGALMQVQVVLERLGFGPGVIDGKPGMSTTNALRGFQESRDLPVTGELDSATRQALARWNNIAPTRLVTIPPEWAGYPYAPVPEGAEQQAAMATLGYETLVERLAERFHTTPEVLARLNGVAASPASSATTPSATPTPAAFAPGRQVRVPNVGADRIVAADVDNDAWRDTLRSLGVGSEQPQVARIDVDESEGWLKAYAEDGRLVALFTVTTGSSNDPLPLGEWGINGVAHNPTFAYDPDLFWDVPDNAEEQQLPPGPNGPVGVVWIDLTKDHYGIHGTPDPEAIGRTESHGCVRLTNWDAARLAEMVSGSTTVIFES